MFLATPRDREPSFLVSDQTCKCFSLDQIRSATQNFDEALVIGRGGFGDVYKGQINDASNYTVVAIKKSSSMSNQGALEFRAEVEMLSKVRHCNLVSLIGYCYEGTEMALVYEYMPEGTLEDHLHKDGSPLSWLQLLKICKGAARGLDYLHTGTGTQHGIIHRDVKSSNVLLDENFAAKISDFGLAKIGPTNQTRTHVSTMVKGTFGYLDPSYVYTGNLTIKSDVYSFGVLLLEVICGRPAVDTSLDERQWGLAPWAQDRIKEGKLNDIIDYRLRGQITSNCVKEFARIACRCLDNNPNQRPTMTDIIGRLDLIILSLHERLDSPRTEGKFIDKFQRFFRAKDSSLISPRPLHNEGGANEKDDYKVDNAMVTIGKSKVDFAHKDVLHKGEQSGQTGKVTLPPSPQSGLSGTEGNLKRFSYKVIQSATRNFKAELSYTVFEGWIDESSLSAAKPGVGTPVAVKVLNQQSHQDDQEFLAEINHLSMLNHPNLVKLIGYCLEDDHRFLVSEFIPRSNLENQLLKGSVHVEALSWKLRMKIVLGAAKGLAYIHSQEPKMICCDIKSSCILLDSEYNAKLSKLVWRPDYHRNVDAIEDVPTGCSSRRKEIYSFGVVLLEVFTGKRNIDNNHPPSEQMQVDFLRPYLASKRRIIKIIDGRINGQYTTTVAKEFAMIVKRCLSIEPGDRPTADEVVKALEELQDIQKTVPSP